MAEIVIAEDALVEPDKYVVFKREDWDHYLKTRAHSGLAPDRGLTEIPDATVIRGQDIFAGPALHVYSYSIALAASFNYATPLGDRLRDIADLFATRAVAADENPHKKMPD